MQETVITLATPVFFLLIFAEWVTGRLRGRNTYRWNDALNSIGLGIISQVIGVFTKLLQIGLYALALQHLALFKLPADNAAVWLGALLAYDFCYYWLHRMGHEVNILWAAHVVHHQSEDYNLSTALRQTGSGVLLGWIFYLPLAIAGVPVTVFAAVALIDLLYQFWVHTQQIGKLGWFDRVFVSPSNHRAHHGVNDIYLDRNYGGILVLWDRLFGTFIEEDDAEPVVYGTRAPLRSWNPLWANLEVYHALWLDAWHARKWGDKLRVWFARPGWRPVYVAAAWPKPTFDINRNLFHPAVNQPTLKYCILQFVIVLLVTTHFLGVGPLLPWSAGTLYGLWIVMSLWSIGGLMEGGKVYRFAETLRLIFAGAMVMETGSWFGSALEPTAQAAIGVTCLFSLIWEWRYLSQATVQST